MTAETVESTATPEPVAVPRCRRFSLLDGMILLAAAGVWFAYLRVIIGFLGPAQRTMRMRDGTLRVAPISVQGWTVAVWGAFAVALIVATLAYLAIRLRRPRPPFNELWRQPGVFVCLVVVGLSVISSALPQGLGVLPFMSLMVLVAWVVAWRRGVLRSEAGWIDRTGRVLGGLWILVGPVGFVLMRTVFR